MIIIIISHYVLRYMWIYVKITVPNKLNLIKHITKTTAPYHVIHREEQYKTSLHFIENSLLGAAWFQYKPFKKFMRVKHGKHSSWYTDLYSYGIEKQELT